MTYCSSTITSSNISMQPSPLEHLLTQPSHSTYYLSLLHLLHSIDRLSLTELKWHSDITELTEEICQEILPLQVPTVISSRDKVIQTKLLYRSYYTPCLLFCLNRLPSAVCPKCSPIDGTFYHMMWECPPVRLFWLGITAFINSITQIPNVYNPLRCLLGYIDDDSLSKNKQLFLR